MTTCTNYVLVQMHIDTILQLINTHTHTNTYISHSCGLCMFSFNFVKPQPTLVEILST